ncbi:MAG TPA: UDP-N-acetylmuramoyl-L-alanine--D-glutamate ligase [Actinomycetes bacterium]|nr:UDP-N-acetylmuramoyl-L-alanine--D-glutamate ligase [Actinomycetes bacterium]
MEPTESEVARWLGNADRASDWSGVTTVVAGLGLSGFAAADALLRVGARVTVLDHSDDAARGERADVLRTLGAVVQLGSHVGPPGNVDLLIPSPGLTPSHPWVHGSSASCIWSGEQLAWRLRPLQDPAPWLVLSGTNGKTTTVEMLASMLRASGLASTAAGNVGRPLVEAVFAEPSYDVLAVELSSFQLHWTAQIQPHAAALLNIAVDHVDWHGSMAAYVADKAKVLNGATTAVIYNREDPETERLARQADVAEGCRGVGFTMGIPDVGMLGVVDDVLVDRAFIDSRRTHAQELATVSDVQASGAHNVANALAAAALARSIGTSPAAVRQGLLDFAPAEHRLQSVATIAQVKYINDSKATNVHAADVALAAFDRVVWIAGGLAKGGRFDDLVKRHRSRLRAVVLLGADRSLIRQAVERHAPEIPVIEVPDGETNPMEHAVRAAAGLARPDDTVLLAPAGASMDQFTDYADRGRAFVAAVRRLGQ